jgi:Flp pilus assembly protein TadB
VTGAALSIGGLIGALGLTGALLLPRSRVRRRFVRLTGGSAVGDPSPRGARASAGAATAVPTGRLARLTGRVRDPRRPLAAAAGGAVALLVGGWPGLACGIVAALVADRLLRRLEPPSARAERTACVADLPLAADLLAAALRSGAPVDRAVGAVAAALGGPLGGRLGRTARSLRLGADPPEAWEHLAGVPGSDRLTAAAVRSTASGAALAGALTRIADDLRADRAVAVEAAARRAGVLIVLPLGLCFLPAFILAGLVPVIVAVLGDVL